MNDNAVGIKIVVKFGKRKTVIFVNLICSVFNSLAVLGEVIVVIMRLIVAADVYANKTRELNVFTVHYPVCIAAVNAKTVLSDFIKYSRVGCVAFNVCNLRSPTLEAVAITIGFFLHGSFTVINRSFSVWYAICCKNRVTVLPGYCVFVDNFIKYSCVGCVACNV